ncbi:MAG TPA: ABC transporter permease [Gemmatimonadaceae bacterium]|nr:ABC transporter permease [Gemmatimonadaceae bacterium]
MIRPGIREFFRLPNFSRRLQRREVDDEIAAHIALRVDQLMRQGVPESVARDEARRRFGPMMADRDPLYQAANSREVRLHMIDRIDAVHHDILFAIRQLRRAPTFIFAAVATLALGLGANATMFGTIDRLLFRPPAYVADPARVVTVGVSMMRGGAPSTQWSQSWQVYQDLRRATDAFANVATYTPTPLTLGEGSTARRIRGMRATATYFRTLGVKPLVGRFFTDDEASGAPAALVAIISERFWRTELLASTDAIGRTIPIAGTRYQVIGIAPAGFTGVGQDAVDVWIPMMSAISAEQFHVYQTQRQWYWLRIVARLRPGMSAAAATSAATLVIHAGALAGGFSANELARRKPTAVLLSVVPREARASNRDARATVLLGAVSLLVLILACANVANLQLARALRRQHEIAVRLAIGIGRLRLVGQLLIESVLLALLGGAAAIPIAWWGGEAVRRILLGGVDWTYAPIDVRIVLYTLGISLVTGVLTGMFPALRMSRASIAQALVQGPRVGHGARSRERFALLALQSALTVILLVGTGLFVRSLMRIEAMPTGIDVDRVLVASLNTAGRTFSGAELDRMYQRLYLAARAIPEVEHATLAFTVPFGSSLGAEVRIPGRDSVELTSEGGPYMNPVTPDYFATLGTRIVRGRTFDSSELNGAPAAIVNETAARLWWPHADPLAQCIYVGDSPKSCSPIVGVAQDTRRQAIVEDAAAQFYIPSGQAYGPRSLLLRTHARPEAVAESIRRQLQNVLPASPYIDVTPLERSLMSEIRPWRLGATMFGGFGIIALVLAAIGLYGVLAYDVAQRTRELGVRVALGALPRDISGLVVRRGLQTVAIGGAVGFVVAIASRNIVSPMLFRTSPLDPVAFIATALLVLIMAVVSTLLPARRAARVDPIVCLRAD